MVITFADIAAYLTTVLGSAGYGDTTETGNPPMPLFAPGPTSAAALTKKSPQAIVWIAIQSGAGLTTEQLFDRPFVTIRSVGRQLDYDGAEKLAYDVDNALLALGGNATVGAAKVLYFTRTGGGPSLYNYDDADRYAFTCTYIAEVQR